MASKHPPVESFLPPETAEVRAVVADDDDDNRALFVAALRRDGFEASEVRNGNELVDRVATLRREGRDALVVVSDVCMPECDGIQAATRLRQISLTLPIVLVTASNDPNTWRAAAAAGADAVLQKPVAPQVLTRAVRHAMGA
jgi:CheY-like chemotaxis protein